VSGVGKSEATAAIGPEAAATLAVGEVAERLMAALLKSAESKDFVGSNPTLSAT
jgi:hypothetical protein